MFGLEREALLLIQLASIAFTLVCIVAALWLWWRVRHQASRLRAMEAKLYDRAVQFSEEALQNAKRDRAAEDWLKRQASRKIETELREDATPTLFVNHSSGGPVSPIPVNLPDIGPVEGLSDMDVETMFNARRWLQKAMEAAGAEVTGKSIGPGVADLDFVLEGMPFNVSLKAREVT